MSFFKLMCFTGHIDFTVEVERALRVLDGAVVVLDASAGVQAQTVTVWRQADKYNLPRIVIVNKLDKPNANLQKCVNSLRDKLPGKPIICHVPYHDELTGAIVGFVDLISLDFYPLNKGNSDAAMGEERSVGGHELTNDIVSARETMIEQLADVDDSIADVVLSEKFNVMQVTSDVLIGAIRRACVSGHCYPVLCGSALHNLGVKSCLNSVCHFLPSPVDTTVSHDDQLFAYVYKIFSNPEISQKSMAYVRVYNGVIRQGTELSVVGSNKSEIVKNRIFEPFGDQLRAVNEVSRGRLGVLVGLRHVRNGDTLSEKGVVRQVTF